MIARLSPCPSQIRWYVKAALNAFDTLDEEDALELAKSELRALLKYLDDIERADQPASVTIFKGRTKKP